MEKNTKILLIVCVILVGVLSLTIGLLITNQSNTPSVLNTTNNTTSTLNNSINQTSKVQNQTKNQLITEQQAINIYKKNVGNNDGGNYRYVATLFYIEGKPYYGITIINKDTGGSEDSPAAVNAVTGKIEGPD
jgi:predicted PurR-regulated permease PerM